MRKIKDSVHLAFALNVKSLTTDIVKLIDSNVAIMHTVAVLILGKNKESATNVVQYIRLQEEISFMPNAKDVVKGSLV